MSAECKLARWFDVALAVRALPVPVWERPALAAVVPENVRGLSAAFAFDDALAEREPARAAPALAGLCLGFMPAARPLDAEGGRPLPRTVEFDAAEAVWVRSAGFLVSVLFCALLETLTDPTLTAD